MNSFRFSCFVFLMSAVLFASCRSAISVPAEGYVAFSLTEAQRLLKEGNRSDSNLMQLGGISRLVGLVIDRKNQDIILIGKHSSQLPAANLEDLITALQARLFYDELPLVSIDPIPATAQTGFQQVRFGGHIENTSFGSIFLANDVLLKKYSLEQEKQVDSVSSYKKLYLESELEKLARQGSTATDIKWINPDSLQSFGKKSLESETSSQTRYWFVYKDPYTVKIRSNVFCIMDLDIILENEVINAKASKSDSASSSKLTPNYHFASSFSSNFYKIGDVHPSVKKLKLLFDMTAIAEGLKHTTNLPDITYLLKDYKVKKVDTQKEFGVIKLCAVITLDDGKTSLVQISGGIEPSVEVELLNAGDVSYLEKFVLESRPAKNSLFWRVPIENWEMPNSNGITLDKRTQNKDGKAGFSLVTNSVVLGDNSANSTNTFNGFSSPRQVAEPISTKGVQMRMIVDSTSFKKVDSMKNIRDRILKK